MKRNALLVIMTLAHLFAVGQVRTTKLTVYNSYRPAIITLADGRTLKQPLTNVFLKNAALLYMSGNQAKEANMKTVVSVQFDDRLYVRIDSLLAFQVDSAGADGLYRATIIDREAYEQNLKNNVVLSDLSLLNSDMVGTTTVDLNNESDYSSPSSISTTSVTRASSSGVTTAASAISCPRKSVVSCDPISACPTSVGLTRRVSYNC